MSLLILPKKQKVAGFSTNKHRELDLSRALGGNDVFPELIYWRHQEARKVACGKVMPVDARYKWRGTQ